MGTTEPQKPQPACGARHPKQDWLRCTEREDHPGDHAAGLPGGRVYATWPKDGAE